MHPVDKGVNKEKLIEYSQEFLSRKKFKIVKNNNNEIFTKEFINYKWLQGSVEKGKPIPDKTEIELKGETYINTFTGDNAYTYCDHSIDNFQYWVKDNLQKLGLKQ